MKNIEFFKFLAQRVTYLLNMYTFSSNNNFPSVVTEGVTINLINHVWLTPYESTLACLLFDITFGAYSL